jgi:hypothetical protein
MVQGGVYNLLTARRGFRPRWRHQLLEAASVRSNDDVLVAGVVKMPSVHAMALSAENYAPIPGSAQTKDRALRVRG